MPTKNVMKIYVPDAFYHVYNRGWNLGRVFIDEHDYMHFEALLARHLSPQPSRDKFGREYKHFYSKLKLVSYCLMGNHFHILLYQCEDEDTVSKFMTSLMASYVAYFNKRHGRRGSPFESRFKAVWVDNDAQLMHISRYIHLNHAKYTTWAHSSYQDYLSSPREWVNPGPVLDMFSSKDKYEEFTNDYENTQRERDSIKQDLYGG